MARGETYEQFVDKFKQKKTTDDCYTPDAVMDVVNDYVEHRYNVSRETFIRPFWPGGDFCHSGRGAVRRDYARRQKHIRRCGDL